MNKTYAFINEKGNHEYNIMVSETDEGKLYEIVRSQSEIWSELARGEFIMSLLDDGNGYSIKSGFKKRMDYSQICEFKMLLSVVFNHDKNLGLDGGKIVSIETIINF